LALPDNQGDYDKIHTNPYQET
jgi:Papain fold toxin 2